MRFAEETIGCYAGAMEDGTQVTLPKPTTPKEFFNQAQRLSRARRHHELLALEEHYGASLFGRFTPDERNQLEGIFESAHTIVDLQAWEADRERADEPSDAEHPAAVAPVGGR